MPLADPQVTVRSAFTVITAMAACGTVPPEHDILNNGITDRDYLEPVKENGIVTVPVPIISIIIGTEDDIYGAGPICPPDKGANHTFWPYTFYDLTYEQDAMIHVVDYILAIAGGYFSYVPTDPVNPNPHFFGNKFAIDWPTDNPMNGDLISESDIYYYTVVNGGEHNIWKRAKTKRVACKNILFDSLVDFNSICKNFTDTPILPPSN